MVYSPEKKKMFCPYCDGTDCEDVTGDGSLTVCASCGGELTTGQFTSASRCPYCGNYLIFDERVTGQYRPNKLIVFKLGKAQAVEAIDNEFKKRKFAPSSFLSEKSLEDLNGYYVPFFLYDYRTASDYTGKGTKVRTWRSGDYDYTETSFFEVERKMKATFLDIPADASTEMDDTVMDLMEPYDYKEFMSFDPKYLSGFFGEIYNQGPEAYEGRAKDKLIESANTLLNESLKGYTTLTPTSNQTAVSSDKVEYTLFPVWIYKYKWKDKIYPIYVNGQTGKVIGNTPVSQGKVLAFALTHAALIALVLELGIWFAERFVM